MRIDNLSIEMRSYKRSDKNHDVNLWDKACIVAGMIANAAAEHQGIRARCCHVDMESRAITHWIKEYGVPNQHVAMDKDPVLLFEIELKVYFLLEYKKGCLLRIST